MRIDSINSYTNTNLSVKNNDWRIKNNYLKFQQKPDEISFSGGFNTSLKTGLKFQSEAMLLFTNPKYATSFKTFRGVFNNISRCVAGIQNDLIPIIIENEHQLKFIENVLAHDIEPSHPIIEKAKFHYGSNFLEAFEHIKTEENMQAKSCAFDFLMKHPENIFDYYSVKFLLSFSQKECHKKHLEFIDNNYDTIVNQMNISNKKLMNYMDYVNRVMDWELGEHLGEDAIRLWNVLMSKENILDVARGISDNAPKGSREYNSRCGEHNKRVEYYNRYFNNEYLLSDIENSPKAKRTAEKLRNVLVDNDIDFNISARNLGEILYFDENITIPELLFVSEVIKLLNSGDDKCHYQNNICDAYKQASPYIGKYRREKINYNEYNRKFLHYVAFDTNAIYFEPQKCFLNKDVLESIQTPEQLATVMKLYNAVEETKTKLIITNWELGQLIGKYNLSAEDILEVNKKYHDDDLYFSIMQSIHDGTFKTQPAV